ncbi:hypothetical protein I7I52_01973 [Histoplasma capsulatum]|uniref:Uncharacterized protein n=1 Tax=Ajellomyces capsulatus TaxID=5037 RepID=A0A8H8D7H8_AJECA|nr:hypothetical protein I7I52_01973 [Histoplasma capsulatum]
MSRLGAHSTIVVILHAFTPYMRATGRFRRNREKPKILARTLKEGTNESKEEQGPKKKRGGGKQGKKERKKPPNKKRTPPNMINNDLWEDISFFFRIAHIFPLRLPYLLAVSQERKLPTPNATGVFFFYGKRFDNRIGLVGPSGSPIKSTVDRAWEENTFPTFHPSWRACCSLGN